MAAEFMSYSGGLSLLSVLLNCSAHRLSHVSWSSTAVRTLPLKSLIVAELRWVLPGNLLVMLYSFRLSFIFASSSGYLLYSQFSCLGERFLNSSIFSSVLLLKIPARLDCGEYCLIAVSITLFFLQLRSTLFFSLNFLSCSPIYVQNTLQDTFHPCIFLLNFHFSQNLEPILKPQAELSLGCWVF